MCTRILIILTLAILLCNCGYTIIKDSSDENNVNAVSPLSDEKNKISSELLRILRLYEQCKSDSINCSELIETFRIVRNVRIDKINRVWLQMVTDWTRDETYDSLKIVGSSIENNILINGSPVIRIWLSPDMIRRVASWPFVRGVDIIILSSGISR